MHGFVEFKEVGSGKPLHIAVGAIAAYLPGEKIGTVVMLNKGSAAFHVTDALPDVMEKIEDAINDFTWRTCEIGVQASNAARDRRERQLAIVVGRDESNDPDQAAAIAAEPGTPRHAVQALDKRRRATKL